MAGKGMSQVVKPEIFYASAFESRFERGFDASYTLGCRLWLSALSDRFFAFQGMFAFPERKDV